MQVSLTYKNDRLKSIIFANFDDADMSRMARIDIDIVKAVGLSGIGTHPEQDGKVRVFDREFAGEQVGFTKSEEERIKKVLRGYCIAPKEEHVADCACEDEYNEIRM